MTKIEISLIEYILYSILMIASGYILGYSIGNGGMK